MKKLRFFDTPQDALDYTFQEFVATLTDDMENAKLVKDPGWEETRDKIHDLEIIRGHCAFKERAAS